MQSQPTMTRATSKQLTKHIHSKPQTDIPSLHHKTQHLWSPGGWPCSGLSYLWLVLVSGVQTGEGHLLDHLWHSDLGIFFKGIHHESIAPDIVHTLETEGTPRLRTHSSPHWIPDPPGALSACRQGPQASRALSRQGQGQHSKHHSNFGSQVTLRDWVGLLESVSLSAQMGWMTPALPGCLPSRCIRLWPLCCILWGQCQEWGFPTVIWAPWQAT